ncbi:hypothetical protein DFH06DRAFT_1151996 [Mycena polygramma]|nr:hypothetical protein DFH06DRAFT_1151996 [Mycena polygramma]
MSESVGDSEPVIGQAFSATSTWTLPGGYLTRCCLYPKDPPANEEEPRRMGSGAQKPISGDSTTGFPAPGKSITMRQTSIAKNGKGSHRRTARKDRASLVPRGLGSLVPQQGSRQRAGIFILLRGNVLRSQGHPIPIAQPAEPHGRVQREGVRSETLLCGDGEGRLFAETCAEMRIRRLAAVGAPGGVSARAPRAAFGRCPNVRGAGWGGRAQLQTVRRATGRVSSQVLVPRDGSLCAVCADGVGAAIISARRWGACPRQSGAEPGGRRWAEGIEHDGAVMLRLGDQACDLLPLELYEMARISASTSV